jgi:hypothetical protein
MNISIIFIHKGYDEYMEFTLRQVKYSNPNSDIILLGDESNNKFPFLKHVDLNKFHESATEFAKIYKHYSTNPYNFELFCFQRWFIIKEFLEKNNYSKTFVFDTDIMLYSNISQYYKNNLKENISAGLCVCNNSNINACTSFWTYKSLNKFCNFLCKSYINENYLHKYKNVWQNLQKQKRPGGACDMTALSFHYENIDKKQVLKLNGITASSTFDENINTPNGLTLNEYSYNRIKSIELQNKQPYCFNQKHKKSILFNSLHFQGSAKFKVAKYYLGPKFKNIFTLKIKFKLLDISTFIYKKLPQHIQLIILNKINK